MGMKQTLTRHLEMRDYFYLFLILWNIFVCFYFISIKASIRNVNSRPEIQIFMLSTVISQFQSKTIFLVCSASEILLHKMDDVIKMNARDLTHWLWLVINNYPTKDFHLKVSLLKHKWVSFLNELKRKVFYKIILFH